MESPFGTDQLLSESDDQVVLDQPLARLVSPEFSTQKPKALHIAFYYFVPFVQFGLDKLFRSLWVKEIFPEKLGSPEIVIAANLVPAN